MSSQPHRRPMAVLPYPKRARLGGPGTGLSPTPAPFSPPTSTSSHNPATQHLAASATTPAPPQAPQPASSPNASFPSHRPDAPFTLRAARALRAAVLTHGSPDDILAYRLLHELLFSPTTGMAERTLAPLARALRSLPGEVAPAGDGRMLLPLSALPPALHAVLCEGADLPRVVGYVPPEAIAGYDGGGGDSGASQPRPAHQHAAIGRPSATLNTNAGASRPGSDAEADAAVRALADNVRYAFEYYIPRETRMRRARVWRGVPADAAQHMLSSAGRPPLLQLDTPAPSASASASAGAGEAGAAGCEPAAHAHAFVQSRRLARPADPASADDRVAADPLYNDIMMRRCRGYVAVRPRVPRLVGGVVVSATATSSTTSTSGTSGAVTGADAGAMAM